MCGNSTCTNNETYICCTICNKLVKIKDTYIAKGRIPDTHEPATFRICKECKDKFKQNNIKVD